MNPVFYRVGSLQDKSTILTRGTVTSPKKGDAVIRREGDKVCITTAVLQFHENFKINSFIGIPSA